MEMGELDLLRLITLRLNTENARFDISFTRHYWKEMLECVAAIHEHDVVHSDLKPANFVLVQGRLKLIDFGIANAIETDETVNVHRATLIGTPNYMSPESLMDSGASSGSFSASAEKDFKLGKPSDIWSLGCILYQMTYGRQPFAHIANQHARMQAIVNPTYAIEYASEGVGAVPVPPGLLKTMRRCLDRDQTRRPTATQLLMMGDPFLCPDEASAMSNMVPIDKSMLQQIVEHIARRSVGRVPTKQEIEEEWPAQYFDSVKRNYEAGKA